MYTSVFAIALVPIVGARSLVARQASTTRRVRRVLRWPIQVLARAATCVLAVDFVARASVGNASPGQIPPPASRAHTLSGAASFWPWPDGHRVDQGHCRRCRMRRA
jgi:hypothetical protein